MTTRSRKTARGLALDALARIADGAYANLVLPGLLDNCGLSDRDRRFATDLVYGTTRMRRACDFLVDRFVTRDLDPRVRDALRLGAYQLAFLRTPPHAAVGSTVDEVAGPARGLVNAVLRKVAADPDPPWPDPATRLSYPDWIVQRLSEDIGADHAVAALAKMNEPATVHERPDGYIQDPASEAVARYVGGAPGEVVADVCAAPGGKATLLASLGAALVVAGDVQPARSRIVAGNVATTGTSATVAVVTADATRAPIRRESCDRVLVDAPCSGLGVLRRRADARWRISQDDVDELAALQRRILTAAVDVLKPGGLLVYSVCTLTEAEGPAIDRWLESEHPNLVPEPPPGAPWRPCGRGARLLPQDADTDGMYMIGLRRTR
ncbi:MAG TPA: transcription antitermination factor NusB [Acidimicrobiales bacterium]